QALDEALCFGWIDGVRRKLDTDSFTNRYTPRTKRSYWSEINIAKYEALAAAGRVHPAGGAAFEARDLSRQGEYSSEARGRGLDPELERDFQTHPDAWAFFRSQPPGYRKTAAFWVMSAKQEATRKRRLATLIEDSANGRRIGLLARPRPDS
ncbi:MAG: YdeI/OmpD-associated family protein, partial [Tepidiformaceae bacterium]